MRIKITKGLTIPIAGEPVQVVENGPAISKVALLGQDYLGIKPSMMVNEGDEVKLGQALFVDRRHPDVPFTSPGSGRVLSIVRGPKRVLQAVIIALDGDDTVEFERYSDDELNSIKRERVIQQLASSGLWTAFRTRPYSKIPALDTTPHAIFVTAIDSNPLAADPALIISEFEADFNRGLDIIAKLTEGSVYVCHGSTFSINKSNSPNIKLNEFHGPHPSGLVGTHIHFLEPVINKTVWHIGYQDVIAIGKLFSTGQLWVERFISLAGPMVHKPRLIKTRLGASTEDIVRDNIEDLPCRVVSGSVLAGHHAVRWASFLGRYHTQLCALPEGGERELFGWLRPTGEKFSVLKVLWEGIGIGRQRKLRLSTLQNGSPRAIVPIGNFEAVMPLDILATPLLKALAVGDTDMAQKLGCLELDEEDLGLCSFACSGKSDYGRYLRECLIEIERNG